MFRIASFVVDLTPPVGHPIAYGINTKSDSPLYLRGVVLDDGTTRAVLAVADYIFLWGGAYHQWKRLLSRAAGAPSARVLLHAIHQHDSILPTPEADTILAKHGFRRNLDPAYWKEVTQRVHKAVESAVRPGRAGAWRRVTSLATAERRVSGLGANRRLVGDDGKVWGMRFSMCTDSKLQSEPVGTIDPLLRTIGFFGRGDKPMACLHFYATHPMAAYGRNRAGSDVPGRALDHVHAVTGKTQHAYFTGCGANVTFGKYVSDVKEKSLAILGKRLGDALEANTNALEPRPLGPLTLRRTRFELPLDSKWTLAAAQNAMEAAETQTQASGSARRLALLQRWQRWGRPWVSRLSLGPEVHLLSLPSEIVVEYQLYAQKLIPEQFLACAAYGEGSFFYIPTAAMYEEGGYEPKHGLWTPAVETRLKRAIDDVLRPLR